MEEKEKNENEPGRQPKSRALVIGAILIVLIAIVGVLVITKFGQNPNGNGETITPVKIKLLIDSECSFCLQTNTIIAKFNESNILYETETIDIFSEEGKKLSEEFDIAYAPTALVNVKGLDQNSEIQRALQGQFIQKPLETKGEWIIVPELFLDGISHVLTFIQKPASCEIKENKILLTAYMDYGNCVPCREAHFTLDRLQDKYPTISIDYNPIVYARSTIPQTSIALINNKGAYCAKEAGYISDYTECNYFDSQFVGNLDLNGMRSCFKKAGGTSPKTIDSFNVCLADENSVVEQALARQTEEAFQYSPKGWIPAFLLDCQYAFAGHNSIESYLCQLHPELEGCLEIENDTSQNENNADENQTIA